MLTIRLMILMVALSVGVAGSVDAEGVATFMAMAPSVAESDTWTHEDQAFADFSAEVGAGSGEEKNPRLAMLYSLLLPGMGELYLGHKNRGAAFLVAEAGIWTTHFLYSSQADTRKRRYREYAFSKAGVPSRDDDELYRQMGIYLSSDGPRGANETVRRVARAKFPNDREAQDEYVLENGFFGEDAWEWESRDAFDEYGAMRERTLTSEENARLSLGLLVANRLLSVVDTGLLGRKYAVKFGDDAQADVSWNVTVGPKGPNASIVLSRSF